MHSGFPRQQLAGDIPEWPREKSHRRVLGLASGALCPCQVLWLPWGRTRRNEGKSSLPAPWRWPSCPPFQTEPRASGSPAAPGATHQPAHLCRRPEPGRSGQLGLFWRPSSCLPDSKASFLSPRVSLGGVQVCWPYLKSRQESADDYQRTPVLSPRTRTPDGLSVK